MIIKQKLIIIKRVNNKKLLKIQKFKTIKMNNKILKLKSKIK